MFLSALRAGQGTNISGQGLGLNLAREVACLHGSNLRLVSSSNKGTEFEVWFRLACDSALSPPAHACAAQFTFLFQYCGHASGSESNRRVTFGASFLFRKGIC